MDKLKKADEKKPEGKGGKPGEKKTEEKKPEDKPKPPQVVDEEPAKGTIGGGL